MENRFDVLAKSLADSVSRREALSRLGGGVAGLLLAAVGLDRAWGVPGTGRGMDCGNVCNAAFNPTAKATRAQNQQCKQSCLACQTSGGTTCGIASDGTMGCCSGATPTCCGGVCTTLGTDTGNCGTCGNACTTAPANAVPICNNGTCGFACNSGYNNIQNADTCVACIPAGSPVSDCDQRLCCGSGIDCNPSNRVCL